MVLTNRRLPLALVAASIFLVSVTMHDSRAEPNQKSRPEAPECSAPAGEIQVMEGTLSENGVDVLPLPQGFTNENCIILSATVIDTMPASYCPEGYCTFRKNLLSNNPISDFNAQGYGDGYGVRLAYLSLDENAVIVHHKKLSMVLFPHGSRKEIQPIYQDAPYKIVLMKIE